MIKLLNYLLISGLMMIGITACYYDNELELYPQAVDCDTTNITYAATIAPIMSSNCNSCHGGSAPQANVITESYEGLKQIANDDRLWGSIDHEPGYSQMPKDRPKLNDCDLTKIRIWLNNGALNN